MAGASRRRPAGQLLKPKAPLVSLPAILLVAEQLSKVKLGRPGRRSWLLIGIVALCVAAVAWSWFSGKHRLNSEGDELDVAELRRRAAGAEDLRWLSAAAGPHPWLRPGLTRSDAVGDKQRLLAEGDVAGAARAAGVLAAEAQARAARVVDRWVGRVDPDTGLLPRGVAAEDQVWDYANAGADLYPHLLIGAALLRPSAYPALLHVLSAERAIQQPGRVPADVDLVSNRAREGDIDDQIYGTVEYAKDALLPLTERLGRGPWLDRMRELARTVDEDASVRTPLGRIPSDRSETNGQALQVLSRLYWATADDAYRVSAERIARAYLEEALPRSDWMPLLSWDFKRNRSDEDQVQLRDHGNEIATALVEFHLVEAARGERDVPKHRAAIRAMLDRLLERARTRDGLWESAIDAHTGVPRTLSYTRPVHPPDLRAGEGARETVVKMTLSDSWGYLYAAYLTQAMIEETWPGGDPEAARRYRAAAESGLLAASRLELFPWEGAEQDGYADSIEGALYLLNRLDSPAAAAWVDRQAGTLFGAQEDSGRVDDEHLDGNFIRTALLYSAWQTQGARLEPWEPGTMLGAAPDGDCLVVVTSAGHDWSGKVVFDTPRHRLNLGLPLNYPRLNEWPEWFVVEPGRQYRVDDSGGDASGAYDGARLGSGLDLRLQGGAEQRLQVCAA